jgi:hypothetical protein
MNPIKVLINMLIRLSKERIEKIYNFAISQNLPQDLLKVSSQSIRRNESFEFYLGALEAASGIYALNDLLQEQGLVFDHEGLFTENVLATILQLILILKSNQDWWGRIPNLKEVVDEFMSTES